MTCSHISTNRRIRTLLAICFLLAGITLFSACNAEATDSWSRSQEPFVIDDKTYYQIPSPDGFIQKGLASWYGPPFHGRRTSNGEIYNMHSLTAAHKTLPMGTVLLVRNLENGKDILVRVNDRGPFVDGRIIDLSYKAARALGVVGNGTAKVQIVALAEGEIKNRGEDPTLFYKDLALGEFYVQIGSFAKKMNALKLQKRFTDNGHTTVIHNYFGPKDILYRVHVYVGKTLQSAKIAEKSLLERGYIGAFVIAK
ncbi:MAG: septal ring lytic transglycosylase RlpA family protein [Proteobacteria bacterium]|nr:septal ring lytic transglycosylase RlpA family protein [Pseudomonadota bacterium]